VLFRVHRFFLQRESDVFRTMFVCPPTEDGPEGRTDDRPIVLPEVTVAEFESLLKFLYDRYTSQILPYLILIKHLTSFQEYHAASPINCR
jgi:hypothetical protein